MVNLSGPCQSQLSSSARSSPGESDRCPIRYVTGDQRCPATGCPRWVCPRKHEISQGSWGTWGPSWLRNPDGSSYFHVLFLFGPLYDEVPILGIAQKRPHSLIQKFVHRVLGKGIRPVLSRRARWYWMQSEIFPWKRAQEGGILCAKPEVIMRNSGFQLSQKLYEIVYIHMLEILCQICRPFIYVSWLVLDDVLGLHSWSPGNRSPTGDCPAPVEKQFLNQEHVFFFLLNVPSGYD